MMDERDPEAGARPEPADDLLEAVKRRGQGLLDRQKSAAVDELRSVADVMRDAAGKFEERQEAGMAGYVRKAAESLDRFSSGLRERELGELFQDAERAFKRRPAVGLAAAALAGFVIGRFIKTGAKRKIEGPTEAPENAAHDARSE